MHIEDALGKVSGDVAQKLHTGRSRNDQVALDVRIYLKKETRIIIDLLYGFQKSIVCSDGLWRVVIGEYEQDIRPISGFGSRQKNT